MNRLSLLAVLRRQKQPGRDRALVDGGRALFSVRRARGRGGRRGDLRAIRRRGPLAVVAEPTRAALVSAWAAFEVGRPLLPLHPRATDSEHAAQRAIAVAALSAAPITGERPLAILFTSGTSGHARGVELSARAFLASADASARRIGWRPDDRWWLALPWAHVGGLSIVTRCLAARRAIVLGSDVSTIERDRVTLASLVPTQLARMIAAGSPPSHLRAVLLGGAPTPAALLADARARAWPTLATYGLTETCSQIATQTTSDEPGCGRPLDGIDVRIRDGIIEVRGPTLFTRYLPYTHVRAPDDWLRTNDLGRLDHAGNLHVSGRADDVIVTGGEKVMPEEIEAALLAEPAIHAACVFAVDDPIWGQVVAAALVSASRELDATIARVAARLAPHKRPRRYAVIDMLPTTANGKLSRARVRDACMASLRAVAS